MFIPILFTNLVIAHRDDVRPRQERATFSLDEFIADSLRRYGSGSVTPQKATGRKSPTAKRHTNASHKAVTEGPTKRCANCGKKVSQRATYCKGSKCRTAAWRANKKAAQLAA